MTCIVGLVEGGTIYMGGDTLASDVDGTSVVGRTDEKVFISDSGEFIMGFAGSFRVGQLLRYAFTPPEQSLKKDDMAYMVTDFIDAWRNVQKDKGSLKKTEEEESHNAQFLVGYKGQLYAIEDDFDVGRPQDNFYAIGAGAQIAFGAMHATKGMYLTAEERIATALEAAAKYNAACRGPFTILKLKHE